jgi:hypothetical protein
MLTVSNHPDAWSLDGDTIKGTRADGYPLLFRVEHAELEDVSLALAAPAMLAALKDAMAHVALLATGQRPPDSNAEMVDRLGSVIDIAEGR